MRATNFHLLKQKAARKAEWRRYAPRLDLDPDIFGMSFDVGRHTYVIEGLLQKNPTYTIYIVRIQDGTPFAARRDELNDSLRFQ
jgi:hypothetical protein